MRLRGRICGALCVLAWVSACSLAQQTAGNASSKPGAPAVTATVAAPAVAVSYWIRGVVRSGGTRLPGVTVSASHSLTGRKIITSTDVDGSFRLELPGKGRWVLRADFAAFAVQTAELMLTPAAPAAEHNFELTLLSRVPKSTEDSTEAAQSGSAQHTPHSQGAVGRNAQHLSLSADAAALAQAAGANDSDLAGNGASGLANSVDATNQSLSVSGRMGSAQDLGLQNMDDLRERLSQMRANGQLSGFDGGPGGPGGPGGFGGPGGGGPGGGFGGGRFRIGSLSRPHGQIYYTASNSVLDAAPYALNGHAEKPAYGSNKMGAMLGGPLKIPHVYDDGGKTFFFLNYSGTRSSTPYDTYSHVPTLLEREGDFSQTTLPDGSSFQLYDPTTHAAFANNCLGTIRTVSSQQVCVGNISPQAATLLKYIPLPNINNGGQQNYHFSSAAESDQDIFSMRLTHNFLADSLHMPPPPPGIPEPPGMGRHSGRPRNNLSFGINYQRNESQTLEPLATSGGYTHTNGYNANVGWAVSKNKLSNQLRFTWNRSRANTWNYFANQSDPAELAGIGYPAGAASPLSNPANWGVPNLSFTHYQGLNDVTPLQRDFQTFTLSESAGWVHGKHHLHFGGDYRWINNKFYASTNPRGSFTFTGSSTAIYKTTTVNGQPVTQAVSGTGYDFADFLLGYAQLASVAYSQVHNQFLGDSYDLFIGDDWRWKGNFSLNAGLRYEFVSPFREAHNYLANMIPFFGSTGAFGSAITVFPNEGYGAALLHPQRNNFAPRIGLAWKPWGNQTVVRAGYGINYNLGQYSSIVQNLAAQPPNAVTETNTASSTGSSPYTLANGISKTSNFVSTNNYAVDPNYRVAYVQMWNLNIQRELTSTLLVNIGYTGSKGSALDMLRAPNRDASGILRQQFESFNYETSQGSSILHAGSLRIRKRMTNGIAVGGTYTYSKSIDNASSIGNGSQVVAQNDRDLRAERGLSSFDQRHKLTGDWTCELPWGEGKRWLNRPGPMQKAFGDWLLQSTFSVASGTPFTAHVLGSFGDVAGGTNGTLRANYTGQPIEIGDRSLHHWFNTGAFTSPAPDTYGNAGRNTIIGPGSWLMSLVLSKNFPIHDSMGLEARAEADNVFNHPNYSGIDTTVDSPTYGQVISVASMRKMLLSLHYRF